MILFLILQEINLEIIFNLVVETTDFSKTVFFLLYVDDQLISHEEFNSLLYPIDCATV